jgi:erythronate-4-phosphate dehydrogenase
MNIFYEDSMPYAADFFQDLGECQVFSHKTIHAEQLREADVLLVRSTTEVNAALLKHASHLQFVGTATAGTNHVDLNHLTQRNIAFYDAGGCNAVAVAEYVISALFVMAEKLAWQLADKTVGIVGAGHVGSALQLKLAALGIAYKLCDPPLQAAGDRRAFVGMDEIMGCDVITLHVPFVKTGPHATQHLFDAQRLSQLSEQQVLINACRGEVVDNNALLALYKQGKPCHVVLDVWENEPAINLALVPLVDLATAHIAGHTIEGKARGTSMLYQALCQHFALPENKRLDDYLPQVKQALTLSDAQPFWPAVRDLVWQVYDIRHDSELFKRQCSSAEQFGYIRKHYPIRREFSAMPLNTGNFAQSEAIYALGFTSTTLSSL